MARRGLTDKQSRFVDEYLVDLNAKQAAIRSGYSAKTAEFQASRLLRNGKVQAAVAEAMKARSKRTDITQDAVLELWWRLANADPNELIQYRRNCCRHCFGENHGYQWIDEVEFEQAVQAALSSTKEGEQPVLPSDSGGYGFDAKLRPHPKCPKCDGEGIGEVFALDTRELSEQARVLYAGVKVTKDGFEVKMRDQDAALANVARHLGMFNDKLTLKGDPQAPLEVKTKVVVVPAKQPAVVETKPLVVDGDGGA